MECNFDRKWLLEVFVMYVYIYDKDFVCTSMIQINKIECIYIYIYIFLIYD